MDSKATFSNRFTITVNERETYLNFSWLIPMVNADGTVEGQETVEAVKVTMSTDGFAEFVKVANELLEKVSDDGSTGNS